LKLADAPALFEVTGDADVMRHWAPGPDRDLAATLQRIRMVKRHWRVYGFGDWGVFERTTNELIGFVGLHHISDKEEVNIGYAIARSRWRRGYALEACRSALDIGLRDLGLATISVIAPANSASRRLARKLGLRYWKRMRWAAHDRVVYRTRA
jgi:RimJ/RimL family protein N-acetyltransferase